ncbi:MAG TPA: hypothetical protein PKO06_14910, partial [Candidatus Ozemobacteraceae bacterium]|nr:hypothetical protein [Candidatus Ozemobacteraceae bacterium]
MGLPFRFAALFCLSFFLITPPALSLSLTEALALAASHPLLLPADLAIDQEAAARLNVGARDPDTLEFEMEDFSGSFPGLRRVESTLSYRRPLLSRSLVRSRRQIVETRIQRSRLEKERLQWEITTRVQNAFHRVLVNQELLETARESTLLASETFAVVAERVEAGRSPERERLQSPTERERLDGL